jgi:hypothetical protein
MLAPAPGSGPLLIEPCEDAIVLSFALSGFGDLYVEDVLHRAPKSLWATSRLSRPPAQFAPSAISNTHNAIGERSTLHYRARTMMHSPVCPICAG